MDATTEQARQDLLFAALDGEADPSWLPPDLLEEYGSLGEVLASLHALPEVDPPAGWEDGLRRRLRQAQVAPARLWRPGRRWLGWAAGVAAAAVIALLATLPLHIGAPARGRITASASSAASVAGPATAARPQVVYGASAASGGGTAAGKAVQHGAAASSAAVAPAPLTAAASQPATPDVSQRKIVQNADVSLQVTDVGSVFTHIGQLAAAAGGYVSASRMSQGAPGGSPARGSVTVRVPAGKLAAFLSDVSRLGKVTDLSQSSQDRTQQYIDLSGRLAALRAEQKAYTGLLAKAGNISDALKVQQALTNVQAQIESLTMEVQAIDQLSSLATVVVTLDPPATKAALPQPSGPFGARVGNALANSWHFLGLAAAVVAVAIVWSLPWLGLLAVILGLLWLIGRRFGRPRRGA